MGHSPPGVALSAAFKISKNMQKNKQLCMFCCVILIFWIFCLQKKILPPTRGWLYKIFASAWFGMTPMSDGIAVTCPQVWWSGGKYLKNKRCLHTLRKITFFCFGNFGFSFFNFFVKTFTVARSASRPYLIPLPS